MENKKHPHTGHRQRLKDKARASGMEAWPYHEVLELILTYTIPYKDVNPLAHELIDNFGSLGGVLDAGYEQLIKINGVGHETALFLSLLPDIFSKYTASKNVDPVIMDTPYKSVKYFRSISRVKNVEEFYVFCLDNKKKLLKTVKIGGGMAASISIPTTHFAEQISFKSNKAIVVMHSHPGGDPNPTQLDIEATKRLVNIATALGIVFYDHIIVAEDSFYSFRHSESCKDIIKQV